MTYRCRDCHERTGTYCPVKRGAVRLVSQACDKVSPMDCPPPRCVENACPQCGKDVIEFGPTRVFCQHCSKYWNPQEAEA